MLTISPFGSASTGLPVTQWSQYHGDASHSGYSSYSGPTTDNQLWSSNFGGPSDGLVAGNGFLVVSSPGSNGISAINETSGSVEFKYSLNGCYDSPGLHDGSSYPAVGGGEVFLSDVGQCGGGLGSYFLRADQLSGGSMTYEQKIPGNYSTSSLYAQVMITYSSGIAFAVPFNTHVMGAFLASTGASLWWDNLGGLIDTIPTVGEGVLAVGFSDVKNVSGINAQTGNKEWSYSTDAQLSGTPAFAGDAFYFGTLNGTLYALSTSGKLLWKTPIGAVAETTPALASGMVFVGADDGYLHAFNASTGNGMWESNLDSPLISPPVVSEDGIVYEATSDGPLYALNETDGSRLWSYSLQTAVIASPVLDNGDLFVVDQTGVIHAFGAQPFVTTQTSTLSSSSTSSTSVSSVATNTSQTPATTTSTTTTSSESTASETTTYTTPPSLPTSANQLEALVEWAIGIVITLAVGVLGVRGWERSRFEIFDIEGTTRVVLRNRSTNVATVNIGDIKITDETGRPVRIESAALTYETVKRQQVETTSVQEIQEKGELELTLSLNSSTRQRVMVAVPYKHPEKKVQWRTRTLTIEPGGNQSG